MNGTPKTLYESIVNGMADETIPVHGPSIIETHVLRFLSQKFSEAALRDLSLTELWQMIIEKPKLEIEKPEENWEHA